MRCWDALVLRRCDGWMGGWGGSQAWHPCFRFGQVDREWSVLPARSFIYPFIHRLSNTHPYIHSSNENSRVDCSRSSSQGAWLAESRSAFTRILAHQPPGQLPLPYPLSREAARMSVRRGASTSRRPKADSKCQHRRPVIPGDQESSTVLVRTPGPAPRLVARFFALSLS